MEDLSMERKYILEAKIRDGNSENSQVVGIFRYYFDVDNDAIARALRQTIKSSLEKGLSRYYGENCVSIVKSWKLDDLK